MSDFLYNLPDPAFLSGSAVGDPEIKVADTFCDSEEQIELKATQGCPASLDRTLSVPVSPVYG